MRLRSKQMYNSCAMYILPILLLVIKITLAAKYLSEKPSFLHPCSNQDPNFDKCNANNLQVIFTEWRDGVPGLNTIGPVDPLEIKRVRIKHDGGNLISLQADIKDVKIYGASRVVIDSAIIRADSFEIRMHTPILRFESKYRTQGNVLGLILNGEGDGYMEAVNTSGTISGKLQFRRDGDLTFLDLQTLRTTFDTIGDMKIQLNNLFGGQKELEDAANALFSENWRDLYVVLRPVLEESAEAILSDRLKKIFNFVPGNYFLADL